MCGNEAIVWNGTDIVHIDHWEPEYSGWLCCDMSENGANSRSTVLD